MAPSGAKPSTKSAAQEDPRVESQMSVESKEHATTSREIDDDENTSDEDDAGSCHSTESSGSKIGVTSGTSVVEYYGPGSSHCGYCKQETSHSRRSYDMHTYSLRVGDYQDLLDRNWRRSGTFSYCPINETTCCPNYPAVCKAKEFKLTRSQRRCIARVNSYLTTGDPKGRVNLKSSISSGCVNNQFKVKTRTIHEIEASSKLRDKRLLRSCDKKVKLHGKTREDALKDIQEKLRKSLPLYPTLEDCLFPQKDTPTVDADGSPSAKHVLHIDMIHVNSERCKSIRDDQHRMLIRYQKIVHKEAKREWTMKRFRDFLVKTPLINEAITMFDHVPKESIIENDTLSIDVNSSRQERYLLVRPPQLPTSYGTYHCNYHLDGKLIATGVLDVLPKCITTVYFFYDPDYDFLNLGIYSALVEISMIRQMDKHYVGTDERCENQLVNYYLGFYVPECKKMNYKTRFKPSYLLCSRTFRYVPIEICLDKLSDKKYADFAEDKHDEEISMIDLLTIPVISPVEGQTSMASYSLWLESNLGPEYLHLFLNGYLFGYAKLIGLSFLPRLTMRVNSVHQTLLERYKRVNRGCESRREASTT